MQPLLPTEALVTYGLLTASIAGLWMPALSHRLRQPALWIACFGLSAGYAMHARIIAPVALATIGPLFLAAFLMERGFLPRLSSTLTVTALSLILLFHLAPGFIPLKVIDAVQVSPDALSYSKSLNFDKPLIGLSILAFGHRLLATPEDWKRMLRAAVPYIPPIIGGVLLLSFALGYVRLDVKWPSFGWFWLWTNLFFTCIPEEAFFRGVVQRHLERLLRDYSAGRQIALGMAAVAFGLAHFAGGWRYVVLATAAGWGYGYVYQRTRCIEAGIIAHFSLNAVHFLCFTYPVLATAVA